MEEFVVFGLQHAYICTIQLQQCITCKHKHRYYGPDLGDVGIFNWNNSFGFTHELLNQYTNTFTTADNPFNAFVLATCHLYLSADSPIPLCSTETFTCVWFAFTDLQQLESGMKCSICGPHPDIVIADGVSIGYSMTKRTFGLHPPSLISKDSPTVSGVNIKPSRMAIPNPSVREVIKELTANKIPPASVNLTLQQQGLYPVISQFLEFYILLSDSKKIVPVRELLCQVSFFHGL